MAAKVIWYREAWWVRTRWNNKKKERKIGSTKADKRRAEKIAEQINARLALGMGDQTGVNIRCVGPVAQPGAGIENGHPQ